jgi:hypothetical protein
MRILLQTVAALGAFALSGAAHAEILHFNAKLDAASEVPAKTSAGKGVAVAELDTATKMLTYKVTYAGLTGPATMAHFHGPAAAGANAPPVVMIAPPVSPASGSATLTDAQVADLKSGLYYINVHTAANPGGEIRGQVMSSK